MPLREQSRIKATASKAKKPIPAAAPEPSAPPLRGFETKGLWSDEELVAHERRATSPPPSPPAATASEPAPTCSVPCLSRTCPRICELDHGHPPDRDHSHASRPNEAGHTWPASEPAVRPLSVQLPSERLFGIYMRLQADSAERAALIEVQGQVRAIEAELAATARDYQAARDAHDRRHDDYNAARAEVEQLRGKLAEERKDGRAERVMLLRALPLDTGTATDTSGEVTTGDVLAAVSRANIAIKAAVDKATQVRRIAQITVTMAARIAELERAAETSRAEHAAALGLATARIRELEGERDELLDFTRSIASMNYPADIMPWWTREARAIVARIENATK